MRWTDGSVYRGSWHKGVQHGIGIMLFSNGDRRAGMFEQNFYKYNITTTEDYD
jgi:hypothetical protein